ncbi:DUF6087 family protein [Streptomyces sp. NBC_01235]|uniref:DUF6087 family protein n=1 Tax=Streptomyces sp. NBC_01235 TaxID=2903788 RepID=UPI003FA3A57C
MGRFRAVPVVSGDGPRGSLLNPDEPRAVERWNGHKWEPYGVAANLAGQRPSSTRRSSSPRPRGRSHPDPAPASTANPGHPDRTATVGHGREQRCRAERQGRDPKAPSELRRTLAQGHTRQYG